MITLQLQGRNFTMETYSHITEFDEKGVKALNSIFTRMSQKDSILFLGAGASVSDEKMYLSQQLIDLYETKMGKSFDTKDIVELVNIIETTPGLSRKEFDLMVDGVLRRYKVTNSHRILATIPWREIITTNYDLLIEQAYDEVERTPSGLYKLLPIRSIKDYTYHTGNEVVKYVKLNGCLSDRDKYPLVFSEKDFERSNGFYKRTLETLRNLSPNIDFISVGYSYSDPFSRLLLSKLRKGNYGDKRFIYSVDPFVSDVQLDLLKSRGILVIRLTFADFMDRYSKWQNENHAIIARNRKLTFTDVGKKPITIPPYLSIQLGDSIKQLDDSYQSGVHVSDKQFYQGQEPSYDTILRNHDVVKPNLISEVGKSIIQAIDSDESSIVPVIFLKGGFGTGKSTFAYRLINSLVSNPEHQAIGFEIIDYSKFNPKALFALLEKVNPRRVLLLINNAELNSINTFIHEMRFQLSAEQSKVKFAILAPMRENILERYKSKGLANIGEIAIDSPLNDNEIFDLLDKLKSTGLINFRDLSERHEHFTAIKELYSRDSFVALMSIIDNGHHQDDLYEAYQQLPDLAKDAYLYTCLLHQYRIAMPASLLRSLLGVDWRDFLNNVIRIDCKGILIQVQSKSSVDPDLYFKSKHPLIAKKIVDMTLPEIDDQVSALKRVLSNVEPGEAVSRIVVDLLRAIRTTSETSDQKITPTKLNILFEAAYSKLSDDPYFILYYVMNLQRYQTLDKYHKCIELLIYAEGLLPYRNTRFIHRRALINFELARLYFEKGSKESEFRIYKHLREAEDLFALKLNNDLFSHYSYFDYIRMMLWIYENIKHTPIEELRIKIQLDELFDLAERLLQDNRQKILELRTKYRWGIREDSADYQSQLDREYEDDQLRPYVLILKYRLYEEKQDFDSANSLIEEMETYTFIKEVARMLFKIYGRALHFPGIRRKFLSLVEREPSLASDNTIRYNYFMFIAESYNFHFSQADSFIKNVGRGYSYVNPDFYFSWRDSETGDVKIFDAVVLEKKPSFLVAKISELQQYFAFRQSKKTIPAAGESCRVELVFTMHGLRAILK